MRSFDQRQRSYLGYLLLVNGTVAGAARDFTMRIGTQAKHQLRAGRVSRFAETVSAPERETAELYKVSALAVESTAAAESPPPPP